MANIHVQEPENLQPSSSNSNLAPMESDREQILRGLDDISLYKTF